MGAEGPRLQRAAGRAAVAIGAGGLERLEQRGSAKAMLPRMHGDRPEVVFLNTAGGVTGGDRFDFSLSVAGAAVGTTQTAERAYRSVGAAPAEIDVALAAQPGARLHWLPQETILFDGAALSRTTAAELQGDAELILADALVFGRKAMGERVTRLALTDRRVVRRDGRPVLIETVRMGPEDMARPGTAGLRGARAVAALHLLSPDAGDRLARVRGVLPGDGSAAASAWKGRLTLRILAAEAEEMRRILARAITTLTGRPLPRVWPT